MAEKRTGEPQTHVAKQSRKSLTLEMKMNVIRRIENGERQSEVSSSLGLAGSTIRTILKNYDNIKKSICTTTSLSAKKVTRTRNTQVKEMEKLLTFWIDDQTQRNMPLSQGIIMKKQRYYI